MKNKAQNKQKSETDDLHKVQAGKLTLSTLFSKKPVDQEISKITKNISLVIKSNSYFSLKSLGNQRS